jgi:addiction module HigA family antidote
MGTGWAGVVKVAARKLDMLDYANQLRDLASPVKVINRIVNGRTSVSAEMALRLGATFRTSPEFWLNAQKAVDLFRAGNRVSDLPSPVLKAS